MSDEDIPEWLKYLPAGDYRNGDSVVIYKGDGSGWKLSNISISQSLSQLVHGAVTIEAEEVTYFDCESTAVEIQ